MAIFWNSNWENPEKKLWLCKYWNLTLGKEEFGALDSI